MLREGQMHMLVKAWFLALFLAAFAVSEPSFAAENTFSGNTGVSETAGTAGFPNPVPGYGQNPDKAWTESCDGDYMSTMFGRSYLEAQREILVNQTVIRKSDSVLEYTCFNTYADAVALSAAPIFSESLRWALIIVNIGTTRGPRFVTTGFFRPPGSMAAALGAAMIDPLILYLEDNFWHTYLGGTVPAAAGAGFDAGCAAHMLKSVFFGISHILKNINICMCILTNRYCLLNI